MNKRKIKKFSETIGISSYFFQADEFLFLRYDNFLDVYYYMLKNNNYSMLSKEQFLTLKEVLSGLALRHEWSELICSSNLIFFKHDFVNIQMGNFEVASINFKGSFSLAISKEDYNSIINQLS